MNFIHFLFIAFCNLAMVSNISAMEESNANKNKLHAHAILQKWVRKGYTLVLRCGAENLPLKPGALLCSQTLINTIVNGKFLLFPQKNVFEIVLPTNEFSGRILYHIVNALKRKSRNKKFKLSVLLTKQNAKKLAELYKAAQYLELPELERAIENRRISWLYKSGLHHDTQDILDKKTATDIEYLIQEKKSIILETSDGDTITIPVKRACRSLLLQKQIVHARANELPLTFKSQNFNKENLSLLVEVLNIIDGFDDYKNAIALLQDTCKQHHTETIKDLLKLALFFEIPDLYDTAKSFFPLLQGEFIIENPYHVESDIQSLNILPVPVSNEIITESWAKNKYSLTIFELIEHRELRTLKILFKNALTLGCLQGIFNMKNKWRNKKETPFMLALHLADKYPLKDDYIQIVKYTLKYADKIKYVHKVLLQEPTHSATLAYCNNSAILSLLIKYAKAHNCLKDFVNHLVKYATKYNYLKNLSYTLMQSSKMI